MSLFDFYTWQSSCFTLRSKIAFYNHFESELKAKLDMCLDTRRNVDARQSTCAEFLEETAIIDHKSMAVAMQMQMKMFVTCAEQWFLGEGGATSNKGDSPAPGKELALVEI